MASIVTYGRCNAVSSVVDYSYLPNSDLLAGYTQSGMGFQPVTATRTYEPHRNLITAIVNTSNIDILSRFNYTNDPIGRRTARVAAGTAFASTQNNTFGYNIRSEVESADMRNGLSEYEFDPIGNRVEVTLPEEPNPVAL